MFKQELVQKSSNTFPLTADPPYSPPCPPKLFPSAGGICVVSQEQCFQGPLANGILVTDEYLTSHASNNYFSRDETEGSIPILIIMQ